MTEMKNRVMVSPEENAIKNRRKKLNSIYKSKEWRNAVKEFTSGKTCEWCGSTERLTAHHPYRESYKDGTYTDLHLSACVVLCNRCHYAVHHNLLLCGICSKRYHRVGADMCRDCFNERHPEIVKEKERRLEEAKALKKRLRDEEKARVKKWKAEHPIKRTSG